MSSIKVNRALAASSIGRNPESALAMLAAIPAAIVERVTSRELAALLDANWRLAQEAKAIAVREACDEGAIWDAKRQRLVDLAV